MIVRWLGVLMIGCLVTLTGALAVDAGSTTRPAYSVSFSGAGSEHHADDKQNILDSGLCDSAEHVDVSATLAWSTGWSGFRPPAPGVAARPAVIASSGITGSDVKDACGLPLDQAPAGWVDQRQCHDALVSAGAAQYAVSTMTATKIVLAVTAPPLAVPVSAQCSLNIRNDQLVAHVTVPRAKLTALRKGASLTFVVGTSRPGPGDASLYRPNLDCSQPTKPYDGYHTTDRCQDDLSWSGTVKLTRTG